MTLLDDESGTAGNKSEPRIAEKASGLGGSNVGASTTIMDSRQLIGQSFKCFSALKIPRMWYCIRFGDILMISIPDQHF